MAVNACELRTNILILDTRLDICSHSRCGRFYSRKMTITNSTAAKGGAEPVWTLRGSHVRVY
jgi:hypothetical protein